MRKVTIRDVALEAGVSISTVSNALNNVDVLKPETKQHVLEVAKRMNYIPNRTGQMLRAQETRAIGLFVAEMTGNYYGVLADTMHWECQKHGYELYIYITSRGETVIDKILGKHVDAAVVFYGGMSEATIQTLIDSGSYLVFVDREIHSDRISSAIFDSYHAGELAAEYLIKLGHKRIMHVVGLPDNYDAENRWRGFSDTLNKAGLCCPEDYRVNGFFSRDAAYRNMRRYLAEGRPLPDAIFASNDLSAIGCMEALRDAGLRIPEDVSIIGCDDIETCELLAAPLTTIHTGFETQAVIAVNQLMDMMSGRGQGRVEVIKGHLIERGSCGARR
jgi:LacI family purine nucleotide synthesis repressor